jgi:hypothetical protein
MEEAVSEQEGVLVGGQHDQEGDSEVVVVMVGTGGTQAMANGSRELMGNREQQLGPGGSREQQIDGRGRVGHDHGREAAPVPGNSGRQPQLGR